jgi:hypothetical protein
MFIEHQGYLINRLMYKIIICAICHRDFNGQISGIHLKTHGISVRDYERIYGSSRDPQLVLDAKSGGKKGGGSQAAIAALKIKHQQTKNAYYENPILCTECSSTISFENRRNSFCSHRCSAKNTNRKRAANGWTMPIDSREKIRKKLSKKLICDGPFSKISTKTCKFCKQQFIAPASNKKQVCKNCLHLKWNNGKDAYSFRFNVFDYPDLFDITELQKIGWVAFGGKRGGDKNLDGLSRDHRVSVSDSKRYGYDPYYISHPCNCELMPHIRNNKKKTRSSLSYNELVKIVDEYDRMKHNQGIGESRITSICGIEVQGASPDHLTNILL